MLADVAFFFSFVFFFCVDFCFCSSSGGAHRMNNPRLEHGFRDGPAAAGAAAPEAAPNDLLAGTAFFFVFVCFAFCFCCCRGGTHVNPNLNGGGRPDAPLGAVVVVLFSLPARSRDLVGPRYGRPPPRRPATAAAAIAKRDNNDRWGNEGKNT